MYIYIVLKKSSKTLSWKSQGTERNLSGLPSILYTSVTSFITHPAVSPSGAALIATQSVPDRL